MARTTSKPVIERLFAKSYIPSTPEGTNDYEQCWLWKGGINNAGYGLIRINKEEGMALVTRVVKHHHSGVTMNQEVHHTCGNKLCVNPNHLIIGNSKTRQQVRPTGYDHWLMRGEPVVKTCDVCGITTHRLWFTRKHNNCIAK
jgi:hypothetical protein